MIRSVVFAVISLAVVSVALGDERRGVVKGAKVVSIERVARGYHVVLDKMPAAHCKYISFDDDLGYAYNGVAIHMLIESFTNDKAIKEYKWHFRKSKFFIDGISLEANNQGIRRVTLKWDFSNNPSVGSHVEFRCTINEKDVFDLTSLRDVQQVLAARTIVSALFGNLKMEYKSVRSSWKVTKP